MSTSKRSKHKGSKYIGQLQRRSQSSHKSSSRHSLFTLKGSLQITRSGMGFVIPEDRNIEGDVLVRPQDFQTALNGDKVIVTVYKENKHTGKKEGRVEKILERKQIEFVGQIQVSEKFAFFIADGQKQVPDIYIPLDNIGIAKDRDKVVVKLLKWDSDRKPLGKVVAILSPEDSNDSAMKGLIMENGFPIQFDSETINAANALPEILDKKEIKKRKDFRKVLTFTIDPNDSKDFDDAISFKKIDNNKYEIGVHIADVSYYVTPGTQLDKEAYKRATSVYLPDRVNPMLPEHISNMLCSLRPNEDKFTFSAVFTIDLSGNISNTWIGRTVIHSDRRFTYDQVQEVLYKGVKDKYKEQLTLLNTISQSLRKQRFDKGAINFSSQEVRFILDEKAKPIGVVLNESNESHQLIEELMLLANRAVAEYVATIKVNDKSIPFPYRIHDQPDPVKIEAFAALVKKLGYTFDNSNPDKIAESINNALEKCKGKPEEIMIQQLGIRTMAKAAYSPENIGHYGLGFHDYCHFTSPIRRYPDVMVHRILDQCLQGFKPVDDEMDIRCKHCSERERAALETERAANKYKQVEYMQQYVGDEVEAVISGVSNFGFWAETLEAKCEGLVSVKELSYYDDFVLQEENYALVGSRTGKSFKMGDKVVVRVLSANLERRQIDFDWIPSVVDNKPTVDSKESPSKKVLKTNKKLHKKESKTPFPKDNAINPNNKDVKEKNTSQKSKDDMHSFVSPTKKIIMPKKETSAKAAPKKTVAKATSKTTAKEAPVKAAKAATPAKKTAAKSTVAKSAAPKTTAAKKATPAKTAAPKKATTATTKAATSTKKAVATKPAASKATTAKKVAPPTVKKEDSKTTAAPTKKAVAKSTAKKDVAPKKATSTKAKAPAAKAVVEKKVTTAKKTAKGSKK